MQKVMIACLTHRGFPHVRVKDRIRQLCAAGAELRLAQGVSDIAGGRSWLYSVCLEEAERQGRDVLLCLDDDIEFTVEQVVTLVDAARSGGLAVSGIYPTEDGHLAGARMPGNPGRHLVGLGFCAVPVSLLREVANHLPKVAFGEHGTRIWPFCESHARRDLDAWTSEDYDFCRKLGGVTLMPLSVGHIKMVPLYAGDEAVRRVMAEAQHEAG